MASNRSLLTSVAFTAALVAGGAVTVQAQTTVPNPPGSTTPGGPQTRPLPTTQGQAEAPPSPEQLKAAAARLTDRDIQAFAAASSQVRQIKSKWHPQVMAAKDQQAVQNLEKQAWTELAGAVEKNGLSVNQYNQIAYLVQTDPDVQRRVERYNSKQ